MGPGREEERIALGHQADTVLAYLTRRASSDVRALSLFRQTMLRAWGRIDRFPSHGSRRQRVWLLGVAAKVLAESSTESDEAKPAGGRSRSRHSSRPDRAGFEGDVQMLRAAMPRIDDVQRELVTLVHWDGLTLAEAAEVVGLDAGRALGVYSAARANLRAVLEGARI